MEAAQRSGRAQDLAARLEGATDVLIALIEPCSEQQWRAMCPSEGRSVGALVHHIAIAAPAVAGWAESLGNGRPPPVTMEAIDHANAQHAAEHAAPDKVATLDLLRRNSVVAADIVRGLSDQQLDHSAPLPLFGGRAASAQMIVEMILIGHIQGYPHSHLPSIEAAIGG